MRAFVLAWAVAVWGLQQQAVLPSGAVVGAVGLLGTGLLGALVWSRRRILRTALIVGAGLACGFAWAAGFAVARMSDRLAPALEGVDVVVTGVVASLPQPFERGVRFDFEPASAQLPSGTPVALPSRLALAWYAEPPDARAARTSAPVPASAHTPVRAVADTRVPATQNSPVHAGERWRLTVRLKRPHGSANAHTFDYEAWLLERGIGATGYVRPRGERARLTARCARPSCWIERAREHVRAGLGADLAGRRHAGVVVALAVGDQRAIDAADWLLYMRTGVGHLMSISGLHVTMVSGLFAALAYWLWRRSEHLTLRLPARKAAALAAVLAAFGYCLIAGYAVPAQRTFYMLAVVAAALWTDRMQSASRVLCLALFVVLLIDPWAVISPGFWLSFAAVALMFYVGLPVGRMHWLYAWARVQGAITLGLAPLMLMLFQQVSLVSPLANAVAIPLVSFVVAPLALLAAVTPGPWLAALAHALLVGLTQWLAWLDRLPLAVWQQHAPVTWTLLPALLGVLWVLAPRGVPARHLGVLLLLPMYAVSPSVRPAPGAAWLDVLDVGQGLAVVVRTAGHALLYDAGPRYGTEADAGNRVVLPWLRGEGVRALDALMITHADEDHVGGAASVLHALPVGLLWSSLDAAHPLLAQASARAPCRAGVTWTWDGVRFEVLHPDMASYEQRLRTNARSCVLRVSAGGRTALLTGDIEAAQERALLSRAAPLRAQVLLAPHHGSTTSSTEAFVRAVAPREVLVAAGYRNRFGHPRAPVLDRYAAVGATVWRTDRDGALRVRLGEDAGGTGDDGVHIEAYRRTAARYWR